MTAAEYPKTEASATSEAMYRYLVLCAYEASARMNALDFDRPRRREDMAVLSGDYTAALILRRLMSADPVGANAVARTIWRDHVDGGVISSELWRMVMELGLDPDEVAAATVKAATQ